MKEKLLLVKFDFGYWNAQIESLIVCRKSHIKSIVGANVYFGEKAGKHSEVEGTIEKNMFEILSDDEMLVSKMLETFKQLEDGDPVTLMGLSPFDYFDEREEDE